MLIMVSIIYVYFVSIINAISIIIFLNLVFEDIKRLQHRHFLAFEEMNEALNLNTLERSNPSSSVRE